MKENILNGYKLAQTYERCKYIFMIDTNMNMS